MSVPSVNKMLTNWLGFTPINIAACGSGQTAPLPNAYTLSVMARKKAVRRTKPFGTRVEDYPERMSGYERESLAAEALLAWERRKNLKKKRRKLR